MQWAEKNMLFRLYTYFFVLILESRVTGVSVNMCEILLHGDVVFKVCQNV